MGTISKASPHRQHQALHCDLLLATSFAGPGAIPSYGRFLYVFSRKPQNAAEHTHGKRSDEYHLVGLGVRTTVLLLLLAWTWRNRMSLTSPAARAGPYLLLHNLLAKNAGNGHILGLPSQCFTRSCEDANIFLTFSKGGLFSVLLLLDSSGDVTSSRGLLESSGASVADKICIASRSPSVAWEMAAEADITDGETGSLLNIAEKKADGERGVRGVFGEVGEVG